MELPDITDDDALAYYDMGMALLEMGLVEEAVQALRKAVDLAPQSRSAAEGLQRALQEQT